MIELSVGSGSKFECLSAASSQISAYKLSEIDAETGAAFLVTFCAAVKSYVRPLDEQAEEYGSLERPLKPHQKWVKGSE